MINKSLMFDLLLDAFPSAKPGWHEYLAEWEDEELPLYLGASVFAHHIVDSFRSGKLWEFNKGFSVIENVLTDGDDEVKGLVIVGLLEGIQFAASHQPIPTEVFCEWLGPVSKAAWDELNRAWEGKSNLADMVRSENP
jgi:hypothetical protein